MATPLQRLCPRARANNRLLGINVSTSKPNVAARQFHNTQSRQARKAKKPKTTSEFEGPKYSHIRQMVDKLKADGDAIDSNSLKAMFPRGMIPEGEHTVEEYKELLSQRIASMPRPPGYDDFMQRHGFDKMDENVRLENDSQLETHLKKTQRMIQMTQRHLDAENPVVLGIDKKKELPGVVSMYDKGDEYTGADPKFEGDDITSLGHGVLEQHREIREFYRLAAWELPLLTQYAKPFELPAKDTPIRYRHTTYMGEEHPADRKIVVEFCTADLPLTPYQRRKLIKLVGQRYDPQKDLVKMSCESFSDPFQNKRYLGDLIDTLLAEARLESTVEGSKDTFDDVPPDFRHVKWKKQFKFPDAWKITPDRRAVLFQGWTAEIGRSQQALSEGTMVDGGKTLADYLGIEAEAISLPVKVR